MNEHGLLREYIIKKFIITIICVTVAENIITFLVNRLLLPLFTVFRLDLKTVGNLLFGLISGQRGLLNNYVVTFILAAVLILYLIPYAVGIYLFTSSVIKKISELEAKQQEQRAEFDRKRNLMISDIAHDLRTPMTTINGYAMALKDGVVTDPEKQQEYLETIQAKSKRMNDLVELLFEYVKLDSEGFSLDRQDCDLAELLRENAALMYSDIEDAGMEFEAEIPEEQIMVSLDKVQFSRVITNLLVNAIRHNKKGAAILLSLRRIPGMLVIDVADSGEPIPPEAAKLIFDPFAKADKSRQNKGGSGLGLSIAKKIVGMHGYELFLNTNYPGYTKSFEITIPISD